MMKRIFDILFSAMGLFFLSPSFLLIAFLVFKEDHGPIFYRGKRVGRGGQLFKIFKFRTMAINAEKIGGPSTAEDDPRLTQLGRKIRKYKLDELPQLLNVLRGEMSFVGPRPEVPSEVATYSERELKILATRPGITDWASLYFHNEGEILRGSVDPHKTYQEKIKPKKMRLALKYVEQRSFFTDMNILIKTLTTIIKTRR
jgi:lipopolysaccharide/colanic/teichoic acid biosynthesis glycosyltransferase